MITKITFSIILLFTLCSCSFSTKLQLKGNKEATECVVLLHGLGRTADSMAALEDALNQAGYKTVNIDYPSRKKVTDKIIEEEFQDGVQICNQSATKKIHFVTHSLGGIIVRQAINIKRPENLGRVVMLSPPNQGCYITDKLRDFWLYQWVTGPTGQVLGTEECSLPNSLGPVDYPVGVITGNEHSFFDAWFAGFIPGEDDGKVSVEDAKVSGMTDFLVVPESHSFIMNDDQVIEETIYFLQKGAFKHSENEDQQ